MCSDVKPMAFSTPVKIVLPPGWRAQSNSEAEVGVLYGAGRFGSNDIRFVKAG